MLLELAWVIKKKKTAALCGDVFISKLRKFHLSFAIFQYSNPSFPYISHHPLQIFHTCEKTRGRADHRFIFELSSSQESSSTQSVKVRKGNFATQDWTEAVQQNEESFSRSLNNGTVSNWASILSNLGYFCEVRSIIVVCGKIHDAFCRFDHWTVKSQIPLH